MVDMLVVVFSFNIFIFSCPEHPFITALADWFTLVKFIIIIIIITSDTFISRL